MELIIASEAVPFFNDENFSCRRNKDSLLYFFLQKAKEGKLPGGSRGGGGFSSTTSGGAATTIGGGGGGATAMAGTSIRRANRGAKRSWRGRAGSLSLRRRRSRRTRRSFSVAAAADLPLSFSSPGGRLFPGTAPPAVGQFFPVGACSRWHTPVKGPEARTGQAADVSWSWLFRLEIGRQANAQAYRRPLLTFSA